MLTSKYRPPYKRYAAIGIGIVLAVILTWLYQYGAPIGYQVIATTITGEEIVLGPDVVEVHLAHTPLYSAAMQWRIFINSVWQSLYSMWLQLVAAAAAIGLLEMFGRYLYKIYRHFMKRVGSGKNDKGSGVVSKGSPPKSPPFGGIGFSR